MCTETNLTVSTPNWNGPQSEFATMSEVTWEKELPESEKG